MVRCNMCMAKYDETIIECSPCKTDAYLMENYVD